MTPWDLVVWALAASASLVIIGFGGAIAWGLIKVARSL